MNTTFFAIIGTSRNTYGGVRWNLSAMVTEADIIRFALGELEISGDGDLHSWAGIAELTDEVGDQTGIYEREFELGEELEMALRVLNDDGCTYAIWPDDVADNVVDFLDEAIKIGLGDEAQRLVEKYSSVTLPTRR